MDPLSPGSAARMRSSIVSRIPSTVVAYLNQNPAAAGGGLTLMAERIAGGADFLKIHIASKVVAAGSERLHGRRKVRLELNKAADWRRAAPGPPHTRPESVPT